MREEIVFYDYLPYILLVAICCLFACCKTKDNLGVKVIFWMMLIFSAVRYNVGWDFPTYADLIEGRVKDYQFERMEWLSQSIMLLARNTFTQLYFIVNSVIGMVCLYKVCNKYSRDPALSLFFFLTFSLFYLMTMNIIRNFVAILLVMYACRLLLEKKYLKYIFVIIIATGFHSSAVIGFILPIVYYLVFKLRIGKWTNLFFFIASFFVGKIVLFVIFIFSGNPLLSNIVYYIVNNTEGSGKYYQYIFYLLNLVFIFSWSKLIRADDMNRFWITLVNVGVCFWVALSFQYTLSIRMALFFTVWMIIILPSFIDSVSKKFRKLVKQCLILFFISLFFVNLFMLAKAYNSGELLQASFLPYKVFFFK